MTAPDADFLALQSALAGEYSLVRELGRGGMGIVYLARDVQLDRDVAIKLLPAALAATPTARARFLLEARLAAGLSHPHIVPIHRVGEVDGFVFFVMSYVEGETLGDRLRRRGPLLPAEATRVLREVAWALAYAHGRGVVHRDVKPDNILLEAATGRALVTDFGIAQDGVAAGAETGRIMGTRHFMSPEQSLGEPVDGRSDIYALGVVGHLAVSGTLPFEAADPSALVVRQATETPRRLGALAPGIPHALAAAIDRCLAVDPLDRFADGEELAAALTPATEGRPPLPPGLRGWLSARNPLLLPYLAWSGMFGTLTAVNLAIWLAGRRPDGPGDILLLLGITSAPLLPIVGYHITQAYRQFRAGHTLDDLREALAHERRERVVNEALTREEVEPASHRVLRTATLAAGTCFATAFGLMLTGVIPEPRGIAPLLSIPLLSTMALGALSNALDVQFLPERIRTWWQAGLRAHLWNSRLGAWIAKRLGAPDRSRAVEGGVFRATEVALGAAAGELFAKLPTSHREHLAELPAVVESLEARAAEARAELETLGAMAPGGTDAGLLAARRDAARRHLADSVAALEGIRLDLLRLHGGAAHDLAPLTTLMEAAKRIGEDLDRLADAEREVESELGGSGPA